MELPSYLGSRMPAFWPCRGLWLFFPRPSVSYALSNKSRSSSRCIGHLCIKGPVAVIDISTLDELNSDHSPVLLVLDSHSLPPQILVPSIYHTDWANFNATITEITFPMIPLTTSHDLTLAITLIVNTILMAHRSSTTVHRACYNAFIPDLQPLIREKRACRRRW